MSISSGEFRLYFNHFSPLVCLLFLCRTVECALCLLQQRANVRIFRKNYQSSNKYLQNFRFHMKNWYYLALFQCAASCLQCFTGSRRFPEYKHLKMVTHVFNQFTYHFMLATFICTMRTVPKLSIIAHVTECNTIIFCTAQDSHADAKCNGKFAENGLRNAVNFVLCVWKQKNKKSSAAWRFISWNVVKIPTASILCHTNLVANQQTISAVFFTAISFIISNTHGHTYHSRMPWLKV